MTRSASLHKPALYISCTHSCSVVEVTITLARQTMFSCTAADASAPRVLESKTSGEGEQLLKRDLRAAIGCRVGPIRQVLLRAIAQLQLAIFDQLVDHSRRNPLGCRHDGDWLAEREAACQTENNTESSLQCAHLCCTCTECHLHSRQSAQQTESAKPLDEIARSAHEFNLVESFHFISDSFPFRRTSAGSHKAGQEHSERQNFGHLQQ